MRAHDTCQAIIYWLHNLNISYSSLCLFSFFVDSFYKAFLILFTRPGQAKDTREAVSILFDFLLLNYHLFALGISSIVIRMR